MGPSRSTPAPHGPQGFADDDRAYQGSTFAEVRNAVFANPYYRVWGAAGEPPLPRYEVGLWSLLRGALRGRRYPLFQACGRTVDSAADLRWGPDGRGFRRLLHPNGVCLTGTWEITEPTEYTGYFRQHRRGLVVARYSTNLDTRRGRLRSLAMVGKLYPTADPDDPTKYRPAAFVTQQDFGGHRPGCINDVVLRNAPDTHGFRRGLGLVTLLFTGFVLGRADREPTQRQVYEIAELGEPAGGPTRAPEFLQLLVDPAQPRVERDGLDFRDEILEQIYNPGDPAPRRAIVFHIEVSDDGVARGPAVNRRRVITNWRRIGRLVFREAVASYNGDFVIHFHHPGWRADRNDPATAARRAGRRVR